METDIAAIDSRVGRKHEANVQVSCEFVCDITQCFELGFTLFAYGPMLVIRGPVCTVINDEQNIRVGRAVGGAAVNVYVCGPA